MASIIDRQIAKPSPMPLDLVVNNGLKIRSTIFGSIPFPVSATEISTPFGSSVADLIRKIRGHFFSAMASIALVIRFVSTCCSWIRSPFVKGRFSSNSSSTEIRFLWNSPFMSARTSCTRSLRFSAALFRPSLLTIARMLPMRSRAR